MYLSTISGRFLAWWKRIPTSEFSVADPSELSVSCVEANQILDLKMEDFVEETSQFPALNQEE